MASIASNSPSLPISADLFFMFPDDIIYQILYFLTLTQRATASLVSRKWHHMIASFNDHHIVKTFSTKYVTRHAADKTVMEFYLLYCRYRTFDITPIVVDSRLLAVLHLNGCKTAEKYFCDIKELPSLKEIYFYSIWISGTTFSKLINKCPSIVELTLDDCRNLHSISVPDLNRLKKVNVSGFDVGEIEIKSRNLQEFHFFSSSSSSCVRLDFRACTKLQVLKMDCNYILRGFPEDIFRLLFRVLSCLKSLFLRLRPGLNKIELSSTQLENLALSNIVDLQEAIIVTPNLRSLKLIDMKKLPRSIPVVSPRIMEVEIGLKYIRRINKKLDRLLDLRTFVENFGENISFTLETNSLESKVVRSNIQPLCIKHITLEILSGGTPRYECLIEELFTYFHPRTLLVKVNRGALKHNFVQVLLDELNDWERECNKCYICSNYMCWRYCLKGFKILNPTRYTGQGAHQKFSLEFQW